MRTLEYFAKDAKDTIVGWDKKLMTRVLGQLRELEIEQPATRSKPWRGNGWTGFEITTSAARVVGTLEDPNKVVVLHAFRKDSKEGRKTRQRDVDLIEDRHKRWAAQRQQGKAQKLH